MPDSFAVWLGVAGFALALVALGWQVWTYREDRRERIDVRLGHSMGIDYPFGTIEVHISNVGKTSIYLKGVALAYEAIGEVHRGEKGTVQEIGGEIGFVLRNGKPDPLATGDRCTYVFPNEMVGTCEHLSQLSPDMICINVFSGKGLLSTIRDPQIHLNTHWIAEAWSKRPKEPAKPEWSGGVFGGAPSDQL